ncbi:MAG: NAD(P)-binding protein [Chlorobi bacterium]|nr:NAD(P)-binding protein [Chlorobiota bacterium]
MKCIVIGSGFGGLAAAVWLQTRGHEVTLVEERDKPGDRAYVDEQNGCDAFYVLSPVPTSRLR